MAKCISQTKIKKNYKIILVIKQLFRPGSNPVSISQPKCFNYFDNPRTCPSRVSSMPSCTSYLPEIVLIGISFTINITIV